MQLAVNKESLVLNKILEKNEEFIKGYKNSKLLSLLTSKKMSEKATREKLLDCIQVFSNHFQKVVMLRQILCEDEKHLEVATQHLMEEFGHNFLLERDRNSRTSLWDPVLDATAGWFTWKMMTLDNDEKTLLVHLVLESSACVFFKAAHKVMTQHSETNYFETHADADEEHERMATNMLSSIPASKIKRLFLIQEQGWSMLNTVCDRIANIVLGNA
jgi:hypothetical protein